MRNLFLVYLVSFMTSAAAFAGGLEDMLTVKTVQGQQATLEGSPGTLKVGDQLYFARSPFHFPITAINGNFFTIALPSGSDVAVGQTMIRQPTDAMKKAMKTEERLKKALEE